MYFKNIIIFSFVLVISCQNYEITSIRTRRWPAGPDRELRRVAIGFFDYHGVGNSSQKQYNFYESLAYALVESGYTTKEAPDTFLLLKKNELPTGRILTLQELFRFSGQSGEKLLLQGDIYENRTETLLEDFLQVMINVSVYDMRTGLKIGVIKLFAKDMKYNNGREILAMTRKIVNNLDNLISNRTSSL